jgi:hypothetical protein
MPFGGIFGPYIEEPLEGIFCLYIKEMFEGRFCLCIQVEENCTNPNAVH